MVRTSDIHVGTTQPTEEMITNRERVVNLYAKGFPRFAAQQARLHNGSIHRRFDPEGELLIGHWDYRTGFASERLRQWYLEHPEAARRLSGIHKMGPDTGCDMKEHDALMEDLEHAWLRQSMYSRFFHSSAT